MSSFLCGCCRRRPDECQTEDAYASPVHSRRMSSLLEIPQETETLGQTVGQLQGELGTMNQRKEDEGQLQQEVITASLEHHSHQMEDTKLGHDTEMAALRQSNRENTKACAAMAKMNASNERVNVMKSANAQRVKNLEQRLGALCSGFEQRLEASEMMHSRHLKSMGFSHVGLESEARAHNASDLTAQCHESTAELRAQQTEQSIDDEQLQARHGQEMCEMKSSSDAKTATHETEMGRMNHKNEYRKNDANHMALHFVPRESKLEQSEAVLKSERRRDLLVVQSEVIVVVKTAIEQGDTESEEQTAAVKRSRFSSDDKREELRALRNEIQSALDSNHAFDEEMTTFLGVLSQLNVQMRGRKEQ